MEWSVAVLSHVLQTHRLCAGRHAVCRPMLAGRMLSSTVWIQVCRGHPRGLFQVAGTPLQWWLMHGTHKRLWSCNVTKQREKSRANYFRGRHTTSSATDFCISNMVTVMHSENAPLTPWSNAPTLAARAFVSGSMSQLHRVASAEDAPSIKG